MRRAAVLLLAAVVSCRSAPAPVPPPAPPPPPPAAPPVADRSRVPLPGPPPALKVPPQRHFQLSNGLKVRLVEHHRLPIVALHLVVDAGGVHDPRDRGGLAGFTAAMMTEGTKSRSATQISDELASIGASLSAGAGMDAASLSGETLTAHLDQLLDLFADVLLHPTFPAADFARVQDQRLVALVQQRDQPGAVAAKAFGRLYWGDHPYGHWPLGTEESVRATTRADLAAYHAARWRPSGSELVVVGDVRQPELAARLERALAGWTGPAPRATPVPAARPPRLQTLLIEKRGPAPQAYAILGMPGLTRSSPDYVPAQVAFEVLGGGTSSRLFRNLREKEGYTYGMYAREEARKLGGTSVIVGSVKSEVTGAALKALLQEVADLRDQPVPAGELEVARNALVLSLPSDFATVGGIAGKLAEEVVYGLPDDYWDRFAGELARVKQEDVQRVARSTLDPSHLTTVMVCDPAVVKPQLAGLPLGEVQVRAAR